MNIKRVLSRAFTLFTVALLMSSCFSDLDTQPLDDDISTPNVVYSDEASYISVLAKCYSGLAVTGQVGPAGNPDINRIDEGFSSYLRLLWKMQELPTEEAVIGWNDQTIADFHDMDWTALDGFISAMYSRIYYQISVCNEFLRQTEADVLDERGVSSELSDQIQGMRAEARFLRALSYYHALDFFRNIPFVTEDDPIGAFFPQQRDARFIYDFIETELLDIEPQIAPVRSNDYARADQGAVWALLAKLYLNAEVYIGEAKWDESLAFSERIINAGYQLDEDYEHLFLADNHLSDELIFPIAFDGINTRTWGGTTFIIRASIGGDLDADLFGVVNGWGGTRTTPELINKFGSGGGGEITGFNQGETASYRKLFVPGDHQGYVYEDGDNDISSPAGDNVFEGYKYFPDDNSTFEITRIPANALKLGDNDGDGSLESNGAPIVAGEAGLYYIKVDLNDNTYVLERQDWSIEGDAISGGQADFVWNEEAGMLRAAFDLLGGTASFVSTGDNGFTLGDNELDRVLDKEGAAIEFPAAGPVEIFLDVDKPDYTYSLLSTSFDRRAIFSTEGQTLEIDMISEYSQGYAVSKFKNVTRDGLPGSNRDHVDTDFPVFRLADFYLMASECLLRSGGDISKATDYFNAVRERTYKGPGGNITSDELDLDLLIDERARELYWECHRRTDLVRFGLLTGSEYLWSWKGGIKAGQAVEDFRIVYPIPVADLNANPTLVQNEGY